MFGSFIIRSVLQPSVPPRYPTGPGSGMNRSDGYRRPDPGGYDNRYTNNGYHRGPDSPRYYTKDLPVSTNIFKL